VRVRLAPFYLFTSFILPSVPRLQRMPRLAVASSMMMGGVRMLMLYVNPFSDVSYFCRLSLYIVSVLATLDYQ